MSRTILIIILPLLTGVFAFADGPGAPGGRIEPDEQMVARIKQLEREAANSPVAAYQLAKLQTDLANHLCGTGYQIELQDRTFTHWLAIASPQTTNEQRDAIWGLLISGAVPAEGARLFSIYQKVGLDRIDDDLKRAEKMVPESEPPPYPYKRLAFDSASKSLRQYVAAFERYRTGSIETLIAQYPHGTESSLHGNLDRLARAQAEADHLLWDSCSLAESLVRRKDESLEPMLKVVAEHESIRPPTLLALGRIGGERVVAALKALAARQTNVWDLRDTYYALLLCHDDKVVAYLQTPANTSHTPNAPTAAAWALKSHGLDASAYESVIEKK